MKNNRTIILTLCCISLCLAMLIAGSKIFVRQIGFTDEIDNSLTTQPRDLNTDDNFDYPFSISDEDRAKFEDFALTPQELANKAGDIIKYLFGYTGHTAQPAKIEVNGVNPAYIVDNVYVVYVRGNTGRWHNIQNGSPTMKRNNSIVKSGNKVRQSVTEKETLRQQVKSDLDVLGYTDYVLEIDIEEELRPGIGHYNVMANILLSSIDTDMDNLNLYYISDGNGNYEFVHMDIT